MPTARAQGWKFASGTLSVASMAGQPLFTAWTVQSDQKTSTGLNFIPWAIPLPTSKIPRYARYTTNADLSRSADGFFTMEVIFSYWTFGMVSYWNSQLLPSSVQSAAVTVLVYDETNTAAYYNMTLLRAVFPDDGTPVFGGFSNITHRFINGVVAT